MKYFKYPERVITLLLPVHTLIISRELFWGHRTLVKIKRYPYANGLNRLLVLYTC